MNQFMYWSERIKDYDKFIQEENERQQKANKDFNKLELIHGWIYKKAAEMKDEIMISESEKTLNRKIDSIVKKGFVDRRNNPNVKYDRTYQYRVNYENIIKALIEKGYVLEGYKVDINIYKNLLNSSDSDKGQNDDWETQNDALKRQIDDLKRQIDALNGQGDGAIPKTTIETTIETTPFKGKRGDGNFNKIEPNPRTYGDDEKIKALERKLLGWTQNNDVEG